ncbi:MAG: hypothetical protein R3E84_10800 [Pseudomonadales bacterium]
MTPARSIAVVGLLTLGIGLACLGATLGQPWLGLTLDRQRSADRPPDITAATGPAASVPAGTQLIAIAGAADRIALLGDDLHPEPQLAFLGYADYNRFFDRQHRLAQMLREQVVFLELGDGSTVPVQPQPGRPWSDLPFGFWVQFVSGLGSLLAGGALLAFRSADAAVRWCVLAGVGIMLAACTAAVFSTRELALPLPLFSVLSSLNRLGTCLASAGFIATIWLYPVSLTRRSPGFALLGAGVLVWLGESFQCLPTGPASSVLFATIGFPVAMLLALLQWRRRTLDLRAKAALKWFLLSWLGGGGFFVFAILAPALAGRDVGELTPYAFGALLMTVLGLTLGVARYRLFDLDRWAFRILSLVAGGFAVLLLDVLLVQLMQQTQEVALVSSLLIAGWLYFPARQWLSDRLFSHTRQLAIADVPALLRDVLINEDVSRSERQRSCLQRLFAPLQLSFNAALSVPEPRLEEDGLALHVPGIVDQGVWEMRMAAHGQRLFNNRDLNLVAAIQAVLEQFVRHEEAIARNIETERRRVAQDLHDDVGARLLTLLHRSTGEHAEEIRRTLSSLRKPFTHLFQAPGISLAHWPTCGPKPPTVATPRELTCTGPKPRPSRNAIPARVGAGPRPDIAGGDRQRPSPCLAAATRHRPYGQG